jgi:hypothetical protein
MTCILSTDVYQTKSNASALSTDLVMDYPWPKTCKEKISLESTTELCSKLYRFWFVFRRSEVLSTF